MPPRKNAALCSWQSGAGGPGRYVSFSIVGGNNPSRVNVPQMAQGCSGASTRPTYVYARQTSG